MAVFKAYSLTFRKNNEKLQKIVLRQHEVKERERVLANIANRLA